MSINVQTRALWDGARTQLPIEVVEQIDSGAAKIIAQGQTLSALNVGDLAPDFELVSDKGERISLAGHLQNGPVVLMFYRGHWCLYCNAALAAYEGALDQIASYGASLLAISPQSSAFAAQMRQQNALSFDLLVDAGGAVAEKFGLRFEAPPEHLEALRTLGTAIEDANDDGGANLPIPAAYLIAPDGHILWRHFDPDYRVRPEVEEIVAALERWNKQR